MIEKISNRIDFEKLKIITIATFVCGFIAHAYVFLNSMYIQDSAGLFWNTDLKSIIVPGRMTPFAGLWSALLSDTKLPWINGLIILTIYSISSYLTCEILEIRSKTIMIIISCILIVNPACISANVYTVSIEYSVALLFGVLATYFIIKSDLRYKGLGIIFVFLCLGTYGPYVSWSISLIILKGIKSILTCDKTKIIIFEEMKCAVCYIVALLMLLGFCSLLKGENQDRVETAASIVEGGSFFASFLEQIRNTILSFVPESVVYRLGIVRGFNSLYSGFFIDNKLLVISFYIAIAVNICAFFYILKKEIVKEVALFLHLIMLIIVMDLDGIVTQSHTLMQFAYIAPWILVVMSYEIIKEKTNYSFSRINKIVVVALSIITIVSGVLLANTVYLKEENTYIAALMLTNRIADKMEGAEGYIPGQTEVWFIGNIKKYYANELDGYSVAKDMMGVRSPFFDSGIHIPVNMEDYLVQHAKLNVNINIEPCFYTFDSPKYYWGIFRDNGHNISEDEFCDAYNQAGTFPENNCTFWCDGVLIFKLGSNEK